MAADAMAVPPMPTKWTDLISDENIVERLAARKPGRKEFFLSASNWEFKQR